MSGAFQMPSLVMSVSAYGRSAHSNGEGAYGNLVTSFYDETNIP